MNEFIAALRQFLQGLRLWVTVTPWEQAIRVRLGKTTRLLGPGVHLKIPLVDMVYLQSIRMRITMLSRQTVSTSEGQAVTVTGAIGYSISDIERLYKTLHHAEDTIMNLASAAVAKHIARSDVAHCTPETIEQGLKGMLDFSGYGISFERIYICECAVTRTYRVLQESWGGTGSRLTTEEMHQRTKQ